MKKTVKILAIIMAALVAVCAFASCSNKLTDEKLVKLMEEAGEEEFPSDTWDLSTASIVEQNDIDGGKFVLAEVAVKENDTTRYLWVFVDNDLKEAELIDSIGGAIGPLCTYVNVFEDSVPVRQLYDIVYDFIKTNGINSIETEDGANLLTDKIMRESEGTELFQALKNGYAFYESLMG